MKIFVVTSLVLVLSGTALRAQVSERGTRIGLGIEALSGEKSRGIGYSLQIQSPVSERINWTVTLGKTDLRSSTKVFPRPKYQYLLLKGGARYYFDQTFYLAGDIGAAFDQVKHGNTYLALSPGVGAEVTAFGANRVDLGFRYERYTTNINFLALRLALNFGY
ncbi:hypothetical protein [Pedobacter deserti]|uniref:hypothetical protein n=1 Tax=Pedobacter deserti TaxID=2817382 RepID=UPI00210B2383|nr:hypothetical protein [Pedobacter sp. SYSU D00382]